MHMKPKGKPTSLIYIRAPETLKDQIEEAAKANGRSVNKEVIQRLRASLEGYRKF